MALARYELGTISRSAGRSATAAAAYISCGVVHDRTTGEVHDYRKKRGLSYSFTVLPNGNDTDREALWNLAEASEHRSNSVVARSLDIALPHEADSWERMIMVSDHARYLAKRHRVAVDVAIHEPPAEGDPRNWHAHFLLTSREIEVDPVGRITFGKKTRELDERKTGVQHLNAWKRAWEETVNKRLEKKGIVISLKSLKDQGIDRTPGQHHGPALTALRRKERRLRKERRELYIADDRSRRLELARLRRLTRNPSVEAAVLPAALPGPTQATEPVGAPVELGTPTRFWDPKPPAQVAGSATPASIGMAPEPKPETAPLPASPTALPDQAPAPSTVAPNLDLHVQAQEVSAGSQEAAPSVAAEAAVALAPEADRASDQVAVPESRTPGTVTSIPETQSIAPQTPTQTERPQTAHPIVRPQLERAQAVPAPVSFAPVVPKFDPLWDSKRNPRSLQLKRAAATILLASETGNNHLLQVAGVLIVTLLKLKAAARGTALKQIIPGLLEWARTGGDRSKLPDPYTTPEQCDDARKNFERNQDGFGR
jgi:hypothetical protein